MAMRTIEITKGNQYDRDGCLVMVNGGATIYATVRVGRRMDGTQGLAYTGTYTPRAEERAEVEAAIRDTMADGKPRMLRIGESATTPSETPEWRSGRGLTLTEEMDRDDTIY